MFEKSSIFVLSGSPPSYEVFRIETDAETQAAVCAAFAASKEELAAGKERIVFDGTYKPEDSEYLVIESFELPEAVKAAVRNPIGTRPFRTRDIKREDGGKAGSGFPDIRAIFIGEYTEEGGREHFHIAFQRLRKEQYISTRRFNLFFDGDTFLRQRNFGFSISDSIDCFFDDGELQFTSFFFTRQIFDLSGYYRSATDSEVASFAASDKLEFEDQGAFRKISEDSWVRRKIAHINDSKVLENYSAVEIARRAKRIGVSIDVKNNKVCLPKDKKQAKVIFGFLDEEAYKGIFSQNTYLANSKRRL